MLGFILKLSSVSNCISIVFQALVIVLEFVIVLELSGIHGEIQSNKKSDLRRI